MKPNVFSMNVLAATSEQEKNYKQPDSYTHTITHDITLIIITITAVTHSHTNTASQAQRKTHINLMNRKASPNIVFVLL